MKNFLKKIFWCVVTIFSSHLYLSDNEYWYFGAIGLFPLVFFISEYFYNNK